MTNAPRNWLPGLIAILIVTLGVYAPSLGNGYSYDDSNYVRVPSANGGSNALVGGWAGIGEYFSSYYGKGAIADGRGFRPVTVMSFALVQKLVGEPDESGEPSATPHHVVNLLLHLAAVFVLFELLALFLGRGLPALVGAAVFGLHALRSDPVLSIVGRAEVMGFLFGGASLLSYLQGLDRKGRARTFAMARAGVLAFLAFGSKESSVAWVVFAPLFVLALGWQREEWRSPGALKAQTLPWLAAYALPLGVFLLLFVNATSGRWDMVIDPTMNPLVDEPALDRVLSGVMILAYGLYKVLFPNVLVCDYGPVTFTLVTGFGDYRLWLSVGVLGGLLASGLVFARRLPLLFLAVAMFFGFSFLTSNVAWVVETIFGERLYYTPATALSFVVALATWKLKKFRNVILVVVGAWLALSGYRIVERCSDWQSSITLFVADADRQPRSVNLQMAAAEQTRSRGMITGWAGPDKVLWKQYLDRARAIDPTHPNVLLDTVSWYIDRARWHRSQGRNAEADRDLESGQGYLGQAFEPKTWLRMKSVAANMHALQADVHIQRRDFGKAEQSYRASLVAGPDEVDAYITLANFLQHRGRSQEALDVVALGEKQRPNVPRMKIARGSLLCQQKRHREAIPYLEEGLSRTGMQPFLAREWLMLAECLGSTGQQQRGMAVLQRIASSPQMPAAARQSAARFLQGR